MSPYSSHGVDRARWQKLDIFQQMGNVASEVGRTFSAQARHDEETAQAALARAIDLLDATVEGRLGYPRSKEILRSKEEFLSALTDSSKQPGIENYFMHFAIAARLRR